MDTLDRLNKLEYHLFQLNNRIKLAKQSHRFKDTKIKRSFGKIFIISGAGSFIDIQPLKDNEVIQLGAFVVAEECHHYKMSAVLAALYLTCVNCNNDPFNKKCITLGVDYYTGDKQLSFPYSLLMGIVIEAKKLLDKIGEFERLSILGDQLFQQHKLKKMTRYREYLERKNAIIEDGNLTNKS